jgi:hypothetical protein
MVGSAENSPGVPEFIGKLLMRGEVVHNAPSAVCWERRVNSGQKNCQHWYIEPGNVRKNFCQKKFLQSVFFLHCQSIKKWPQRDPMLSQR